VKVRKKRLKKAVFNYARSAANSMGYDIRATSIRHSDFPISLSSGAKLNLHLPPEKANGLPKGRQRELTLVYLSVGSEGLDLLENSISSARRCGFNGEISVFCQGPGIEHLRKLEREHSVRVVSIGSAGGEALKGVSNFGEGDFAAITHLKWEVILRSLDEHHKVVAFVDSDIVFLRKFEDYFLKASEHYSVGIQSESRGFFPPAFCVGLMFFTFSAREFLAQVAATTNSHSSQGTAQQIFNEIVLGNPGLLSQILALPEAVFPVGLSYPLVKGPAHPLQVHQSEIIAFHANWVLGNDAKKEMLDSLGLWEVPVA